MLTIRSGCFSTSFFSSFLSKNVPGPHKKCLCAWNGALKPVPKCLKSRTKCLKVHTKCNQTPCILSLHEVSQMHDSLAMLLDIRGREYHEVFLLQWLLGQRAPYPVQNAQILNQKNQIPFRKALKSHKNESITIQNAPWCSHRCTILSRCSSIFAGVSITRSSFFGGCLAALSPIQNAPTPMLKTHQTPFKMPRIPYKMH